jgi:hypothetical protein
MIKSRILTAARRGEVATDSMPSYNQAQGEGPKLHFVECS